MIKAYCIKVDGEINQASVCMEKADCIKDISDVENTVLEVAAAFGDKECPPPRTWEELQADGYECVPCSLYEGHEPRYTLGQIAEYLRAHLIGSIEDGKFIPDEKEYNAALQNAIRGVADEADPQEVVVPPNVQEVLDATPDITDADKRRLGKAVQELWIVPRSPSRPSRRAKGGE